MFLKFFRGNSPQQPPELLFILALKSGMVKSMTQNVIFGRSGVFFMSFACLSLLSQPMIFLLLSEKLKLDIMNLYTIHIQKNLEI